MRSYVFLSNFAICSAFIGRFMLKFNDFGRVEELATPFWYYDMDVFRKTVKLAASLSERYGIGAHYALKANVEPRLVSYIASKGFGADCVSGNEVKYAVESGFARSSIVFAGVGKSDKEISDALDMGIGCFNVESLMEMQVIDALAASKGVRANVSLRINPNIDAHTHRYVTTGLYENKFGISRHEFEAAIDILKGSKALDFKGLHFHIGSQITDVEPVYSLECERAAEIVEWFEAHGMEVGSIDLGGGLGVDYDEPDENPVPDFEKWFSIIDRKLRRRPEQSVSIEPGRSMVAQCGSLITRVLFVKSGETKTFLIMDAGMNDLIRPALYGAYHKIENLSAYYVSKSSSDDRPGPGICDGGIDSGARSVRAWDRVPMKNYSKSSSDDRPGPGICESKYVEDVKAARSVRVWDRVPMKNKEPVGRDRPLEKGVGGIDNDIVQSLPLGALYDIVGPVCESSDVWGEGRELPYSKRGDILAIRSTGAYGSVMSSRYNLRDLAPAVFSDDMKLKYKIE